MTTKKILLVTKDIMSFKSLLPIAEFAKDHGIAVHIAADGNSLELWGRAGFPIEFTGFKEDGPTVKDQAGKFVEEINPLAVIVGCSSQIDFENTFLWIAKYNDIPTAAIADTWGAGLRLNGEVHPDYIFTIDSFDAGLYSRFAFNMRFRIIGDPIKKVFPSDEVTRACNEIHANGKKIIFIVGQDLDYTGDMLELIRECIALEPEKYALVHSLIHPKFKDRPEAKFILKMLNALPHGLVHNIKGTTDEIAACADITASGFSTVLRISAMAGKIPISLAVPEMIQGMNKETNLYEYPLVTMGNCLSLSVPTKLSSIEKPQIYVPEKFNPEILFKTMKLI